MSRLGRSASTGGYSGQERHRERTRERAGSTGGYSSSGKDRNSQSLPARKERNEEVRHACKKIMSDNTHGIKVDHAFPGAKETWRSGGSWKSGESESGRSRKQYIDMHPPPSKVKQATASSFHSSAVGVPTKDDVFTEKVRGPKYNPPDDTYAGTSSNRLDQRDRGLRTNIEGHNSQPNISLSWVAIKEPHPLMQDTLDPWTIDHSAGITSDSANMTKSFNTIEWRGRIPNMLPEKATKSQAGEHLKTSDPITHTTDEEKERRNKGEARPHFMENREDYNIFKKKDVKDLNEHEKKVMYQRRILAVDNHKSTYRIAGDQDLLPGGTKLFSKADRPASTALHKFNDKRLLAGFELDRISKRRHKTIRTNMESRDLRHCIYWVGREEERQAMTDRGYFENRGRDNQEQKQMVRPKSAPTLGLLEHDLGGEEKVRESKESRSKRSRARLQDNRVQRLYYELIRSTRPHMHHDLGTGELTGGHFLKV